MFSIKYIVQYFLLLAMLILSGCTSSLRDQASGQKELDVNGDSGITAEDRLYYRKAITALNNNDLDLAEDMLITFHNRKPNLAGPLVNLGLIHFKRGNLAKSKELLHQALDKNPRQAHAFNLLGQIAFKEGQAPDAEHYYKKALSIRKDYANAHYNLALLYDILFQDIEKAVLYYRRYIEITGDSDRDTINWLEQLENSLKNS